MPPSPADIDAACIAIAARGQKPTVERVRTELGGGSPNVLTPLVRAWRETQRSPTPTERVREPSDPAALPLPVQAAIAALTASIGTALASLSPAFTQALADVAETERRRSRLEIEAVEVGATARIAEARDAADEERATTDLVRQEVGEREVEIRDLREALSAAETATAQSHATIAALTSDLDQARQKVTAEQTTVGQLTEKVTGLEVAAERAAERAAADLARAVADAAAAHAAADAAKAEAARMRDEMTDLRAKLDALKDESATLKTDLAVARSREEGESRRAERSEAEVERLRAQPFPVADAA